MTLFKCTQNMKDTGERRKREEGEREREKRKDCMCKVDVSDATFSSVHKGTQRGPGKEACLGKHCFQPKNCSAIPQSVTKKRK